VVETMGLGKLRRISCIAAVASFAAMTILLAAYSAFGVERYYLIGDTAANTPRGLALWLPVYAASLAFVVSATVWAVLFFSDAGDSDAEAGGAAYRRARNRVLAVSLSTSFASGLLYYTPFYFPVTLFLPFVIGTYVSSRFGSGMPHKTKMTCHNLGVLAGSIFGYMVATVIAWGDLAEMHGEALAGADLFFKSLSVFRIFYFIWLYIFFSWLGMYTDIYKRKFATYEELPGHQHRIFMAMAKLGIVAALMAVSLVVIILMDLGDMCWLAGGIVSIVCILFIFAYIFKILFLFDR
jgi:hypothetical protein